MADSGGRSFGSGRASAVVDAASGSPSHSAAARAALVAAGTASVEADAASVAEADVASVAEDTARAADTALVVEAMAVGDGGAITSPL